MKSQESSLTINIISYMCGNIASYCIISRVAIQPQTSYIANQLTITYKMLIQLQLASSVHAQVCNYFTIVTACMGLETSTSFVSTKIADFLSFFNLTQLITIYTNITKCLSLMHNLMATLLQFIETGYPFKTKNSYNLV